jgi:fumarate hydratase class II
MPGKINPTQCEALMMVATQVIGYDTAITHACMQGNFELNVARPLMAYNLLRSIHILTGAITSFTTKCLQGIKPNKPQIAAYLSRSLQLASALNPILGYDKASKIVRKAHHEDKTLKEAALELGFLTEKEFDRLIDPKQMV